MSFLRRSDRSGTSLIEVLVTLVVFLVGMVSVLRMFPGGFLSMRQTENSTLAHRLAQAEIERWEGRSANLPSGILPYGRFSSSAKANSVLSDIDPANLTDPILPGQYYYSDVNKFRRIIGEATRIPVPSASNWNAGSIYILGYSPIAVDNTDPRPLIIYGGEMTRKPLPSDLRNLELKWYNEYAIDYKQALLYVKPFPGHARKFNLTYSYWADAGGMKLNTVMDPFDPKDRDHPGITIDPPTAQQIDDGYQIVVIPDLLGNPVYNTTGFNGIDEGSDSLHREFEELIHTAPWSNTDPYEFKLVRTVSGVVAFNPLGYGYMEMTSRGREPLTAHIDYTVLDWHIIREERKLPDVFNSAADQDLKLTLRFIKKAGETMEADGSVYGGLAPDGPNYLTYDILAVDVETGRVYSKDSLTADGTPVFIVNYKDGVLRFDPDFIETSLNDPTAQSPFQGKTFRIYYQADGDFALQPFKAYDVYRRSYAPPLDYRQYYFAESSPGTFGRMYFPRCYAGCTVAVDYSYRVNGETIDRYANGETYQISEDTEQVGEKEYCYIDLLATLQSIYGGGADITFQRISKVYGTSVGARVVWRETGRRLRAGSWRRIDLQTYLTRASD